LLQCAISAQKRATSAQSGAETETPDKQKSLEFKGLIDDNGFGMTNASK
jgi:hypothetical protein